MPVVSPEHWFLDSEHTQRRPAFTRGNAVVPLVDGMSYMADLHAELATCDQSVLIAGWRASNGQLLNPAMSDGGLKGESFVDTVVAAARRGCSVKALLFNVPGTEAPGPFRFWHARDNYEFARAVRQAGGEAILDSRLAPVPASAHHQKFILTTSADSARNVAYLGGIDVCLDRWDRPEHDAAPERQCDVVRAGTMETHTPSQPGWHDIQVRLQGPAIAQIWEAFRERWNDPRPANHDPLLALYRRGTPMDAGVPASPPAGTQAVQVNQTLPPGVFPKLGGPGEMTVARAHEHAIDRAEHYVYVEDQYVWPCSLVARLEKALKRGVHVLMVVARDYDAPGLAMIAKRLRHQVVERLARAGGDRFLMVHIERDNGKQIYVHSKVLIVDDCYVSVGSANFNARSLTNDTELQIGVVDEDLVETRLAGKPVKVCRFAHELRCALWAEHLEQPIDAIRDPIAALTGLWPHVPIAPSRRAHRHDASLSPLSLEPAAEYVTTLITERMAQIPVVSLPEGLLHRDAVKLAVDTVIRGPQAALLLKALEEMLNPDFAPKLARIGRQVASSMDPDHAPQGSEAAIGEQILYKLRRRQLPQMVDWFDPGLLVKIGIRDMISGTIGQYADQRLMQAASDHVASEQDLVARYDYSNAADPDPRRHVETDPQGRIWVDYIADLGDGFEATYTMAHLMAYETLQVAGAQHGDAAHRLPAGQILVMGGDQAYPQGTTQEYQQRLVDPYNWAFMTDRPTRKVFGIPGNHDWYDGLNAFSSLFTSARDRISGGIGKQMGGWRCHQHRSYFAIRLPHDWWIWGPDIQLEGNLDDPQRDYFDIVSDYTRPGDKIIICLAEPSWHHENYDNLHEISMLARKRGAKICAVLAGDWHHYSRYTNPNLGVQFITCGGGGAFAHATHQLKEHLDLHWAEPTGETHRKADPADPLSFNRMEQGIVKDRDSIDYSMKDYPLDVADETAQPAGGKSENQRPRFKASTLSKAAYNLVHYKYHTPRIYPSKAKSRLLALRNLFLPFRNKKFALLVGMIYFLYAWVFQVSAPTLDLKEFAPTGKVSGAEALALASKAFWATISPTRVMAAAKASPLFFFMLIGLWAGLIYYVDLGKGVLQSIGKFLLGSIHFFMHLTALLIINLAAFVPSAMIGALPVVLSGGLFSGVGDEVAAVLREASMLVTYAVVSILIGGFVGASIMGLYWTVTSTFLNMHCGDAFGALMIKDYKHFLRLCFERDRVTIYPIAVDKVPGRKGWRVPTQEERATTPSQIVPRQPLNPHLIEAPIVIRAEDIDA